MNTAQLFSLHGKVALVTGGSGVLGSTMARALAGAGAKVGVLGRNEEKATSVAAAINQAGGQGLALAADVMDKAQLEAARDQLTTEWGRLDILVNAAGGNHPTATVIGNVSFFNLTALAVEQMVNLNFMGSLLPSQVFGEVMATQGSGVIINISSMAAQRPLTRVIAYAAAKAALENFTKWLAVELAKNYSPNLRVNAIAPGFFIGEQNRALLLNPDNTLTQRGQQIIEHTPLGRFGKPEELVGTLVWLASDAARFVTGIVVPVDGGFSAFSGV